MDPRQTARKSTGREREERAEALANSNALLPSRKNPPGWREQMAIRTGGRPKGPKRASPLVTAVLDVLFSLLSSLCSAVFSLQLLSSLGSLLSSPLSPLSSFLTSHFSLLMSGKCGIIAPGERLPGIRRALEHGKGIQSSTRSRATSTTENSNPTENHGVGDRNGVRRTVVGCPPWRYHRADDKGGSNILQSGQLHDVYLSGRRLVRS
jgi:hypothetical protein